MHPTLQTAINKANQYLDMLKPTENPAKAQLEKELSKLSKKELIARIIEHEAPCERDTVKIEATVYRILSDPDCVWLDYGTIATMIRKAYGSKTTENSISWYSSKGLEKSQNVLPRKPSKAITALVLSEL